MFTITRIFTTSKALYKNTIVQRFCEKKLIQHEDCDRKKNPSHSKIYSTDVLLNL